MWCRQRQLLYHTIIALHLTIQCSLDDLEVVVLFRYAIPFRWCLFFLHHIYPVLHHFIFSLYLFSIMISDDDVPVDLSSSAITSDAIGRHSVYGDELTDLHIVFTDSIVMGS